MTKSVLPAVFLARRRFLADLVLWAAIALTATAGGLFAAENNSAYRAALESIDTADLSGYVDALTADEFAGRESGTKGGRAAGDYVAGLFTELKLAPGGAEGGYFQPFAPNFRNVIAVLPGSDPQLKDQYLLVGAHYDHVGVGSARTSRGGIGHIHRGADDNASGVAAIVELAKALTTLPEAPKRSIIFLAFDAEEKGLLGSKYWGSNPTVPIDRIVAMLDVDMVGRVRDNRLMVYGARTGYGLRRLVAEQNSETGLDLVFPWDMTEQGDHYSFFKHDIPVLMFHAGLHDDYHTSRDVPKRLNKPGITIASKLLFLVACDLANRDETPRLRRFASRENEESRAALDKRQPRLPSRLGVEWTAAPAATVGLPVARVVDGGPAAKAGLHAGDAILQFGGRQIRTGEDFSAAVCLAENPARATVRRAGAAEPLEIQIHLEGEPLRLGITWRTDDAMPGVMILTHVVPGTPAAAAGLLAGDHIYQVAGHDFATDVQFLELVRAAGDTVVLVVERTGRIRPVTLHLDTAQGRRAA